AGVDTGRADRAQLSGRAGRATRACGGARQPGAHRRRGAPGPADPPPRPVPRRSGLSRRRCPDLAEPLPAPATTSRRAARRRHRGGAGGDGLQRAADRRAALGWYLRTPVSEPTRSPVPADSARDVGRTTGRVVAELERLIASGELLPGQPIRQVLMAER